MGRRFGSYGLSMARTMRSRTLSTASWCGQQPVSSRVRSPPRRCRRSFIELSHSAGGCRMPVCFTERCSPQERVRLASPSGGGPRRIFRCFASHAPLSTSRGGRIASTSRALSSSSFEYLPRHALLSAISSFSHAVSTSSLSTDSIQLPLQRDVRIRYVLSILMRGRSEDQLHHRSGSQPKLSPVIAVRVDESIADGCGRSRSSAQSAHRRHPAGCRSRQSLRGLPVRCRIVRMVFRPAHGRPHAAQSFQSRQGTVPSGTEPIIPSVGTHVKLGEAVLVHNWLTGYPHFRYKTFINQDRL